MVLNKKENESQLQYHKRLINGKLVDKTLADIDYSELSEFVYGQQYSSDVARRMMYGSRRTLELIDEERLNGITDEDTISEIDEKMIELKKERQKFYDHRNAFNKVIRERAREEELHEILNDAILYGNLPELSHEPTFIESSDNDLLVSLNDMHYGIDICNAWNTYNPEVCGEMLCNYLDQIVTIALRHHSENCILFCNGDVVSGNIHKTIQIANRENVVNQVIGASELLAEFISKLSRHFNTVSFVSVAGNHSRLDTKENSPIDERLDDLVEWYLKARLQNIPNVIIGAGEKIDCTMYLVDIRGKTYCGVHGDYEAGSAKIAALQTMAGKNVYAVLSGHLHHNKVDTVQGIKTIMAGSFVGMDDYCVQKRIYGRPEQIVCVCDNTGVVCHYDVPLIGGMNL